MFRSTFLLLLVLYGHDKVWSVRIVELRVPAHAREGGTALLSCQYDLEGEKLYAVKWYKDEQEFYRYIPRNPAPVLTFNSARGVHVNLTRSSIIEAASDNEAWESVVVLENLSRQSEGNYVCEVAGEAPQFDLDRSSKHISIHLLPDSGPHVTGLKEQYYLDEEVIANCTSKASLPRAHLKWLVNDQPVPASDLRGPWFRHSRTRPDATETTLQLRFIVEPRHFVGSAMRFKCQATIAPLYQRETNSTHTIALTFMQYDQKPFQSSDLETDPPTDSSSKQSIKILFAILPLTFLVII